LEKCEWHKIDNILNKNDKLSLNKIVKNLFRNNHEVGLKQILILVAMILIKRYTDLRNLNKMLKKLFLRCSNERMEL